MTRRVPTFSCKRYGESRLPTIIDTGVFYESPIQIMALPTPRCKRHGWVWTPRYKLYGAWQLPAVIFEFKYIREKKPKSKKVSDKVCRARDDFAGKNNSKNPVRWTVPLSDLLLFRWSFRCVGGRPFSVSVFFLCDPSMCRVILTHAFWSFLHDLELTRTHKAQFFVLLLHCLETAVFQEEKNNFLVEYKFLERKKIS